MQAWIERGVGLLALVAVIGLFRKKPKSFLLSQCTAVVIFAGIISKVIYQATHGSLNFSHNAKLSFLFFAAVGLAGLFAQPWILAIALLWVGAAARLILDYTPDTAWSWICFVSDGLALVAVSSVLGERMAKRFDRLSRLQVGLALLVVGGVAAVLMGIQSWMLAPKPLFHLLVVLGSSGWLWKNKESLSWKPLRTLQPVHWGLLLFVILPVITAMNLPAPPDADSQTQAEFAAFLFQGKSMWATATGLPGEIHHLRYPLGMASLTYFSSHITHQFPAETLMVLLMGAYFLFFAVVAQLCRTLRVSSILGLLFAGSITLLSWQGFGGGHGYQLLGYCFGITALTVVLKNQKSLHAFSIAAFLVAAAMLLNPTVGLPFALVLAVILVIDFKPFLRELQIQSLFPLLLAVMGVCILYWTTSHGSQLESQPGILLRKLTVGIFFSNVYHWAIVDLGVPILVLMAAVLPFCKNTFPARMRLVIFVWFLGQVILDGVFGHTEWTGRFYACFGMVGIYAVCVPLAYRWVEVNTSSKLSQSVYYGLLFLWLVFHAARITYSPFFCINTYDDARMGRWIAKNTDPKAYIFNLTAPGVPGYYTWSARGNALRDMLQARINDHHIKENTLINRGQYSACTDLPRTQTLNCLKRLGTVDYLWIVANENTEQHIADLGTPLHRVGMSVLYRVK